MKDNREGPRSWPSKAGAGCLYRSWPATSETTHEGQAGAAQAGRGVVAHVRPLGPLREERLQSFTDLLHRENLNISTVSTKKNVFSFYPLMTQ